MLIILQTRHYVLRGMVRVQFIYRYSTRLTEYPAFFREILGLALKNRNTLRDKMMPPKINMEKPGQMAGFY
jgi:hypothetical protein